MKERVIGFIKTYCLLICIFVVQKPLFMMYYRSQYTDVSWMDWFNVVWHGLPLDLSLKQFWQALRL